MAQETNQTQGPLLCATGCGFYGSPRTNGMCSICYKEYLQRQNANSRVTETASVPAVSSSPSSQDDFLSASSSTVTPVEVTQEQESSGASVQAEPKTQDATDSGLGTSTQPTTSDPDKSKPKKSRCFTCRKKVGLTGFDCRCGNVFCGVHRYSDVHNCTFDYKTDAADRIRKENPVVVSEKVSKI